MNNLLEPFYRILFWHYDNRLNFTTSIEKKYKYLEKAFKYAKYIPDLQKPYSYIRENMRFSSKDEKQLSEDNNKILKLLVKTIVVGITLNLVYIILSKPFFINEPYNWIIYLILWTPVISLMILYPFLPRIYVARFNTNQIFTPYIDSKINEHESENNIPNTTKAKLIVTLEEFYGILYFIPYLGKTPKGYKLNYAKALIRFFTSSKTKTENPNVENRSKYLGPLTDAIKARVIYEYLHMELPQGIKDVVFNGELKGSTQVNINPDTIKQFFILFNEFFYEKLDSSYFDLVISETFNNNGGINKKMDINNLIKEIRYQLKDNTSKN